MFSGQRTYVNTGVSAGTVRSMTSAASRFASRGSRTTSGAIVANRTLRTPIDDETGERSDERETRSASEDRRGAAREQHERRNEQEADVARNDVRARDPEEEDRRDQAGAQYEQRTPVPSEWARSCDENDDRDEREPDDAGDSGGPVDPDEGGENDLVDRRGQEPGGADLEAVMDLRG